MKYLKKFKQVWESTSAGSQIGTDVSPFKYSKVYDPRIGYNRKEFITDVQMLMEETEDEKERDEIFNMIKNVTGTNTIESIEHIRSRDLNRLIQELENFIASKADFELLIYPDGYYLCFEDRSADGKKYDLYYHPNKKSIKIVPQTGNCVDPEYFIDLDKFVPKTYGIEETDFSRTLEKVDLKSKPKDASYTNLQ